MLGIGWGFRFFDLFQILFFLAFAVFLIVFIIVIARSIRDNSKNNRSPVLTVPATVVSKRTHVWGDHAHTIYYATFQVASGDRMELQVPDSQFGYLVENDTGSLTFQGTRFLSFQRT